MKKFVLILILYLYSSFANSTNFEELRSLECKKGVQEGVASGNLKIQKTMAENGVSSKKIIQMIKSAILLSENKLLIDYVCNDLEKSGLIESYPEENWNEKVKKYSLTAQNTLFARGILWLEPNEIRILLKVQREQLKLMSPKSCKQALVANNYEFEPQFHNYAHIVKKMSLAEHENYLKVVRKTIIEGVRAGYKEKIKPAQYQLAVNEMSDAINKRLASNPRRLEILNAATNINSADDRDACDLFKLMLDVIIGAKDPHTRLYASALWSPE